MAAGGHGGGGHFGGGHFGGSHFGRGFYGGGGGYYYGWPAYYGGGYYYGWPGYYDGYYGGYAGPYGPYYYGGGALPILPRALDPSSPSSLTGAGSREARDPREPLSQREFPGKGAILRCRLTTREDTLVEPFPRRAAHLLFDRFHAIQHLAQDGVMLLPSFFVIQ